MLSLVKTLQKYKSQQDLPSQEPITPSKQGRKTVYFDKLPTKKSLSPI